MITAIRANGRGTLLNRRGVDVTVAVAGKAAIIDVANFSAAFSLFSLATAIATVTNGIVTFFAADSGVQYSSAGCGKRVGELVQL